MAFIKSHEHAANAYLQESLGINELVCSILFSCFLTITNTLWTTCAPCFLKAIAPVALGLDMSPICWGGATLGFV